jgi:hypothetical protein
MLDFPLGITVNVALEIPEKYVAYFVIVNNGIGSQADFPASSRSVDNIRGHGQSRGMAP